MSAVKPLEDSDLKIKPILEKSALLTNLEKESDSLADNSNLLDSISKRKAEITQFTHSYLSKRQERK